VVEQLVGQRSLGAPAVRLGVVALDRVQVLDGVVAVDAASPADVELVVEDCDRVVHSALLQVGTLDETVGLDVVRYHPPGVSWTGKTRAKFTFTFTFTAFGFYPKRLTKSTFVEGDSEISLRYIKMRIEQVSSIHSYEANRTSGIRAEVPF